jgi:hypothetical protein
MINACTNVLLVKVEASKFLHLYEQRKSRDMNETVLQEETTQKDSKPMFATRHGSQMGGLLPN